jgi:hypothetical protein
MLLLLLADSLVLYVVFRGLSSPRSGLPAKLRLALGTLAVMFVALGTVWLDCGRGALLAVAAASALGSIGLHGDGMARLGESMGNRRFALYLLSVVTSTALVYLFVPMTTFLTSPGELGIHLEFLLTVNLRDAMVVVYASAALYALLPSPRMKTALTLLAVGAAILVIYYSYVLPFGFPMMTGFMFEQIPVRPGARILRAAIDLASVAAVGLALRWALLRFSARPFVIGLLLANVSLAVAAAYGASQDEVGGRGGPDPTAELPDQPLRFSRTQPNVLIVFLDRFMGSFVESILAEEPGLADRMSGFTWFPRTVAAGENSIAGVHPMLGGYDYTPVAMNARHQRLVDLSTEAFSILPYNFSRKGYRVNVINPGGLGFTMAGDCSFLAMPGVTCTHISPSFVKKRAEQMGFPLRKISESSYADLLVLLASMRAAPYLLKEVVHQRGPWRPFLDHSAGTTFRVWAELKAFPDLSFTDAGESNLNIVSNILPHEPYFLDEDCQPRQERFEVSFETVRQRGHASLFSLQHAIAARCALLMVADYLDFLKAAEVYANTKIVIVSDHGIVGAVEDRSSRAVAGGTVENPYVRTRSVLLVKELDASGPIKVSEEFLPNAEVPRIVCEQIGGCVNPYLGSRPIEAQGRDDPFFVSLVPWQFSLQHPNAFVIQTQLVLTGKDPFNSAGWARVE